jgi:hypothetical protein
MRRDLLFDTINALRGEMEELDHVIRHVEALVEGRVRRGRPPKAVATARDGLESEQSVLPRTRRRRSKPAPRDNSR